MTYIRSLYTGDNLDVMRSLPDSIVDLVYLDPPFNSNRSYAAPIGSEAAGAAFKDTWTLDDVDVAWHGELAEGYPALYSAIHAAGAAHSTGMKAYLIYMAMRLVELKRLMKPTASIYLHCDPTASHYLKMLMDTTFGEYSFQNEITWQRTWGRSDSKRFGRVHDIVLYYASEQKTFNRPYIPYSKEYIKKAYRNNDNDGRGPYALSDLTAPARNFSGASVQPWLGCVPSDDKSRGWSTPIKGSMRDFIIEHNIIPNWPDGYHTYQERLDALNAHGLVYWVDENKPRLKRYLKAVKGVAVTDTWVDIKRLGRGSKERRGWPTQKPLALLERIIKASSNEGDLVLDPFCGCATACVAAERLGRQWIGIDISDEAERIVRARLKEECYYFGTMEHNVEFSTVRSANRSERQQDRSSWKHELYGLQEGVCKHCGSFVEFRLMEVDHIVPRAAGGIDAPHNYQLLCGPCNRAKGTKENSAAAQARIAELEAQLERLRAV